MDAGSSLNFVSSTQVEGAAKHAGLDEATTAALVDDYETAQLRSLKAGLLGAALLALVALGFTRELPHERPAARKNVRSQSCVELTPSRGAGRATGPSMRRAKMDR